MDGIETSLAWRRALVQAGIDIAASFLEARPAELGEVHVAALIPWPKAEAMQVCVFFDLEYFRDFEVRNGPYQRWTALGPERSLARELGLTLPAGLRERRYRDWNFEPAYDDYPAREWEDEIWLFGD